MKLWDLSRYFERRTSKRPTCQISGQIVSEILTQLCEHNWVNISETICPEMLVFGK